MKQYKRLPRKMKKQLGPSWREYLEEENIALEREHHIDKIFNKDYDNANSIIKEIMKF